jgi:hypothetical protein
MTGPHADRAVLVHWHALPHHWPITSRQVMVGPFYDTVETAAGFRSIKVPAGQYDLKAVIDRLPRHQQPEAIIVVVDSTKSSYPRNLAAIDAVKALVMGDTHHKEGPLRTMLGYTLAEPFDVLVGNHLPQHLHFFQEARSGRLAWIPGVWVRQFEPPSPDRRDIPFLFAGATGPYHPYRGHVIDMALAAGLPLVVRLTTPEEAALAYASARLTLNCSLNGDLNQRIFEVMGSAGALITDRLAPEANLERVVTPGVDCVVYDNVADLIDKSTDLLARPDRTAEIARAAQATYARLHTPAIKTRQLLAALFGGDDEVMLPEWRDARLGLPRETDIGRLRARLLLYEFALELHRKATEKIDIAIGRAVDRRAAADLVDLPRLRLSWLGAPPDDEARANLERTGLSGRILATPPAQPRLAVLSPGDVRDAATLDLVRAADQVAMTIADPTAASTAMESSIVAPRCRASRRSDRKSMRGFGIHCRFRRVFHARCQGCHRHRRRPRHGCRHRPRAVRKRLPTGAHLALGCGGEAGR